MGAQAVAVAVALALLTGHNFGASCAGVASTSEEADEEGDTAPFMVVVRHTDGHACGAALVSLRTALSSASCVRGASELWAVAPAAASAARRVLRVAEAAGDGLRGPALAGDPWAGADGDLALLELAAPLPRALAILMATDPADCEPPQDCNLVHLLRTTTPLETSPTSTQKSANTSGEGGATRLRILDAQLEDGGTCAALGPRWSALRERTLCFTGPELCQGDRGTGVVCGGKLCGVVSRSAGAPCGDTHAAASVPRWRRFLHCAHTRGACGRDGDCARLCSERWLVDAPPEPAAPERPAPRLAPAAPPPAAPRPAPPADALRLPAADEGSPPPPRTERVLSDSKDTSISMQAAVSRTEPDPGPSSTGPSPRGAFEFEPNRADFRMSAASTRVFLKAGEYGDNAADYAAPDDGGGGDAAPAAVTSRHLPPPRTGTPPPGTAPAAPPLSPAPTLQPAARKKQPRAVNVAARKESLDAKSAARQCSSYTVILFFLNVFYLVL